MHHELYVRPADLRYLFRAELSEATEPEAAFRSCDDNSVMLKL